MYGSGKVRLGYWQGYYQSAMVSVQKTEEFGKMDSEKWILYSTTPISAMISTKVEWHGACCMVGHRHRECPTKEE